MRSIQFLILLFFTYVLGEKTDNSTTIISTRLTETSPVYVTTTGYTASGCPSVLFRINLISEIIRTLLFIYFSSVVAVIGYRIQFAPPPKRAENICIVSLLALCINLLITSLFYDMSNFYIVPVFLLVHGLNSFFLLRIRWCSQPLVLIAVVLLVFSVMLGIMTSYHFFFKAKECCYGVIRTCLLAAGTFLLFNLAIITILLFRVSSIQSVRREGRTTTVQEEEQVVEAWV